MIERQQVISRFSGMSIDMDYLLCTPSIHAKYDDESVIVSYGGGIKDKTSGFPADKLALLKEWVMLHQGEILECVCQPKSVAKGPPKGEQLPAPAEETWGGRAQA